MKLSTATVVLTLCVSALSAWGAIPGNYHPIVVEAPFSFSERLFDLTPAVTQAKAQNKRLFIYLGANDCPPCKVFSQFLDDHASELQSTFENVVLVDIRTWLKGGTLVFKVGDTRFTFSEWKVAVGDKNAVLTYPYYWLLTPELTQVRQLTRKPSDFTSVDRLKLILAP